jgi:hypothetical protein
MQDGRVNRRLAPGKPVRVRPELVPVYALPLNTLTGWASPYGQSTRDLDVANIWTKVVSPPTANLRLTHVATKSGSMAQYTFPVAKNLTDCFLKIALYVPPGSGATDPASAPTVRVYALSGDGTSYLYWTIARGAQPGGSSRTGWQTWLVSMNVPSTVVGTPDLTAVNKVQIDWSATPNTVTTAFTIGELTFFQKPSGPPLYMVHFDEAWAGEAAEASQEAIADYMASLDMRGSFFLNYARMRSLARYQRIAAMGHLVGNHHKTHSNWVIDAWTGEAKVADVTWMADYMTANGLGAGAWDLAQPNGTYQVSQGDAELFPLATSFRLGGIAVPFRNDPNQFPYYDSPFSAPDDNLTTATAAIATVISSGLPTVAIFHTALLPDVATFKVFIDALMAARDAGTIRVGTVRDWL